MKFSINSNIFALFFVLSAAFFSFACQKPVSSENGADTPTGAYKQLYTAVKAKNYDLIKASLSKQTLAFADSQAKNTQQTLEQMIANGFTATTFSSAMPETRDERVKDNMGAVEVWNSKDSRWEDLPYVNENGWKLAVGDAFGGSFKSPGKGRAQIEAEANSNKVTILPTNVNMSAINSAIKNAAANTNSASNQAVNAK